MPLVKTSVGFVLRCILKLHEARLSREYFLRTIYSHLTKSRQVFAGQSTNQKEETFEMNNNVYIHLSLLT